MRPPLQPAAAGLSLVGRKDVMKRSWYVTTFCNRAHWLHTGRPVGHACYILQPRKLQAEANGEELEGSMIRQPPTEVRGQQLKT